MHAPQRWRLAHNIGTGWLLDHVDRTSLGIQGQGVAFAVGIYAQDQSGRNGVPIRDDRTRHVLTES